MGKWTKKQLSYIKKNYDGRNLLDLSKRLNIPLKEISKIIEKFKTTDKIIEKKYFPAVLDSIYKLTRTDYLVFGVLFLVSLFTYVYTMTPGIAAGDCGELTCAAYFLGGAHSPGYPLYCIMGKLFSWLFFFIGRIVYRNTFLSAFGGAITVSVTYLFFIKFLGRFHKDNKTENLFFAKIPAITASLYFLFSVELWAQAVIGEVYTVSSLFYPIMFLIALVFEERVSKNSNLVNMDNIKDFVWNRAAKLIYLFFFLFGVCLGDHHIILGYFVPFLLFFIYSYVKDKTFLKVIITGTIIYAVLLIKVVYFNTPELKDAPYHNFAFGVLAIGVVYLFYKIYNEKPKLIILMTVLGGFLLLGLMVYAYMPIRSLANAPLDWGDPEKLENFSNVVQRVQYRGFAQNVRSLGVLLQQAYIILRWELEQFTPYIFILIIPGLIRLYKLNKKWFYFTLSFVLYYDLAFMQFNNFLFTPRDLYFAEVFFIPSYMFRLFWIVIGLEYIIKLFETYVLKESLINKKAIAWIVGIVLIGSTYLPFSINFVKNNERHTWASDSYGCNILKTLEYKSILFTEGGDNQVFTLLYHNYVDYLRPDVNDPDTTDIEKKGIFDQKGNVFLLYGDMMRMNSQQLFESQVTKDYERISTGRPIYYTWKDYSRQNEINKRYGENFEYRQTGILYRVCKKNEIFNGLLDYWNYYDFEWKDHPDETLNTDYLTREVVANYCFQLGDEYMMKTQIAYNNYLQNQQNINNFKEYKKYDKLAYDQYRLAQKYGFDMTAIHFNLSLLLEQKIPFLQRENDIEGINKILDECIVNYKKAAETENYQGAAFRAYLASGIDYERKIPFNPPEKAEEYMREALKMYKEALKVNPSEPTAQNRVRRAQAIIDNPDKKVQMLEMNLKKNPMNENLYLELVNIYNQRFEANKSVYILDQALRFLPGNVKIMYNLAYLHQQLREYDKSVGLFLQILQKVPNDPRLYFYIAFNYDNMNKQNEAYNYYKRFANIGRNIPNPPQDMVPMFNQANARIRELAPTYER